MIKRFSFILFFFFYAASAAADPIAFTILGYNVKPYQEAVRGFESICPLAVHPFVLSENKGVDVIEKIRQKRPDLILSVGLGALACVSGIYDIPIVYMMVPEGDTEMPPAIRSSGINMNHDPAVIFNIVKKSLPDIKNIGVIHNPVHTGGLVEAAQSALEGTQFHFIKETISRPGQISKKLKAIKPHIDALWMLPDVTLLVPETIEILLLFSLENKIPIITFSEKYVRMGALLSIASDPFDMGRQAGEMANKVVSGKEITTIPPEYARIPVVTLNEKVMKNLGVRVAEERLKNINLIE